MNISTQLHQEINRLFGHALQRGNDDNAAVATDWIPAVDIREETDRYVLRADVPGVDPANIEITMEAGVLTIRGERADERIVESDGYHRIERVSGRFFRRFTLPDTADAENISATGRNGVLELVIPKHAKVQPRRIQVNA